MNTLELQLQNNIIMYARPIYPYTCELKGLCIWYDDEICFHKDDKYIWILEAIKLRNEITFARYNFWNIDIGFNIVE